MKKAIALTMTLVMLILCCVTAQAELKVSEKMIDQDGIKIVLTKIFLPSDGDTSPDLMLSFDGSNDTDHNLYIRFHEAKVNDVECYGYSQSLDPRSEGQLCALIFTDADNNSAKRAILRAKKVEMKISISDYDTNEMLLEKTVKFNITENEQNKPKNTLNIPLGPDTTTTTTTTTTSSSSSTYSGSVRVGNHITFGSYEQDGNVSNGVEPIEWQVLDINGDRALVVSYYGLFNAKYTEHSKGQTWDTCDLRDTLNSSFYYETFTPSERNAIYLTHVENNSAEEDPSARSKRGQGADTDDYIFILSYGEIVQYLPTQNDRVAPICQKSRNRGLGSPEIVFGMRTCNYWLRNAAFNQNAGGVNWQGVITTAYMNFPSCMVRPCCWVSLSGLGY